MTYPEAFNSGLPHRRPAFGRQTVDHAENPFLDGYRGMDGRQLVKSNINGKRRSSSILTAVDLMTTDSETQQSE